MGSPTEHLITEVREGVAHLVLARKENLNAISASTREQILDALRSAAADESVGAVLLRGAGRSFSVGGDLTGSRPRTTLEEHEAFLAGADAFHAEVRACPLPVVAAVQGHCLGAGLLLAACCDLVVASSTARFGLPEGRIGLVGGTALVSVVGRQWAKLLMFTGEAISPARALAIGLVVDVVPDDVLVSRCTDLAERLARMPRETTALNKQAIDSVADVSGDRAGLDAAIGLDARTLLAAATATAPDGRRFRDILRAEGLEGLKEAREQQWEVPWLSRP